MKIAIISVQILSNLDLFVTPQIRKTQYLGQVSLMMNTLVGKEQFVDAFEMWCSKRMGKIVGRKK